MVKEFLCAEKGDGEIHSNVPFQMKRKICVTLNTSQGETPCHHTTIIEESEIGTPEEDAEDALQSLEDGGQSTVDELKEVNLGTVEEPRLTFISASLSSEKEDFCDLSNACLKDDFPLPITEIMIDATTGHELRMNPLKCAFGVTSGKFIGFIIRHQGIEIDKSKIDAIQKMPRPKSFRDLKSLQDETCQNAFDSIKKYLLNPPVLGASVPGKPLILYIVAQERSLGALLANEKEKGKERALYYLSRTLVRAEVNYFSIEKMCLTLFFAINKLRHYMQAFTVHLVAKADPIKSGARVDIILISPKKHMLPYSFAFAELCSNNMAQYQALIIGLQMALEIGVSFIEIYGDSKLIINLLSLQYDMKHEYLKPYFTYARQLMEKFDSVMLVHVPRTKNKRADTLANLATTTLPSMSWKGRGDKSSKGSACRHLWSTSIITKALISPLHPIVAFRSFEAWGLDLIGPHYSKIINKAFLYPCSNRLFLKVGVTPYSLVYRVKAVDPLEREIPSLRMEVEEKLTTDDNVKVRLQELETLDEKQLEAQQALECYQARMSKAFDKHVKPRSFQVGDLL
ncbi:gypsy-like retrotransposase [Cucumis melo var. makuwa]|uniref:Gypsy-like retrotransposase n=1 Tax=Cucumis melo var. makuwa TaxID=1194695 RepID=A0A5D3DTC7_CUCMM|nr:gypsy-like retrotransposase [Cucumis melo var. makuwa]TYK26749.1 gypsy-like retrotransposase [Cucumis melo var. makuwa]